MDCSHIMHHCVYLMTRHIHWVAIKSGIGGYFPCYKEHLISLHGSLVYNRENPGFFCGGRTIVTYPSIPQCQHRDITAPHAGFGNVTLQHFKANVTCNHIHLAHPLSQQVVCT